MGENIELNINGKNIPMNPFVKKTFMNVIESLVNSLDKLPYDIKQIKINIDKEEKKQR